MPQRIEWRFSEGSVLSIGHWYLNWGDPTGEMLLTLTQVIHESDNPIWCLREHADVMNRIVDGAEELLVDLTGLGTVNDQPVRLSAASPMVGSVFRAHRSMHHALALMTDALVECRKGPVEMAMQTDRALASEILFAMSDTLNSCYRLESHLPLIDG